MRHLFPNYPNRGKKERLSSKVNSAIGIQVVGSKYRLAGLVPKLQQVKVLSHVICSLIIPIGEKKKGCPSSN